MRLIAFWGWPAEQFEGDSHNLTGMFIHKSGVKFLADRGEEGQKEQKNVDVINGSPTVLPKGLHKGQQPRVRQRWRHLHQRVHVEGEKLRAGQEQQCGRPA